MRRSGNLRRRHSSFWRFLGATPMIAAENAKADLIRSGPERAYPAIDADVSWRGVVHLRSRRPNRHVSLDEHAVHDCRRLVAERRIRRDARCARGSKSSPYNDARNSTGRLIAGDSSNSYELRGTVSAGGKTYGGILLTGVPTAFGWNSATTLIFDLNLKITGGSLAQQFGPDAYLAHQARDFGRVAPARSRPRFKWARPRSRIESLHPPEPFPVARTRHTRHPARRRRLGPDPQTEKSPSEFFFYETQKPSPMISAVAAARGRTNRSAE